MACPLQKVIGQSNLVYPVIYSEYFYFPALEISNTFLASDLISSDGFVIYLTTKTSPFFLSNPSQLKSTRWKVYIINLTRTTSFLLEACQLLFDAISKGK